MSEGKSYSVLGITWKYWVLENWYMARGNCHEWDDYIKFMLNRQFWYGEWLL
jgi:hypothetical protein